MKPLSVRDINPLEAFASTKWPGVSPGTFRFRRFLTARELSIFVDESGSQNGHSAYVIVSLVFHEQDEVLDSYISAMEEDLARKGLPNLPFHASPLMYGKGPYKGLEMDVRKKMLACFEAFCRRAPFSCKSFSYKRSEVEEPSLFTARFKRDLVVFLTDNLEYFQNFDCVKIYYDNGQQMVTAALHSALDFILSKEAVLYRMANAWEYRLSQVADCICTLELTDIKFQRNELTETDIKVFGTNYSAFRKNHLKHIQKKEIR
ncbi:MAG: ABC transporter [Coriobacteriaceae bacterium]|nr:ABC transporter [Coriobacteriaceae bacterium]MDY3799810.1 ABC transporter [Eggerthellaceae bacterium]